jgi:hypothetical protein
VGSVTRRAMPGSGSTDAGWMRRTVRLMLTYGVLRQDTGRSRSCASIEEAFALVGGLPLGVQYVIMEMDGLSRRELYGGVARGAHRPAQQPAPPPRWR